MSKHEVTVELAGGKRLIFETGRMAKQASGAALVTTGETVVLATAVASPDPTRRHRLFPPHGGLPRIRVRRWTHPWRIYQARRPAERKGSSDCASDRSPDPPDVPRRLPERNADHRAGFSADKENDPDVVGINAPRLRWRCPTFRFSATVARCALGAWMASSSSIRPTRSARRRRSTSWSSDTRTAS